MAEDKVKLSLRGVNYDFGIVHAQAILSSPNNKGSHPYKLNDDKYTLKNGQLIKRKSNKGNSSKSTTQGSDTEG